MRIRQPRGVVFSILVGLGLVIAGSAPAQGARADAEPAAKPAKREVVVLGASLSAGFICPWTDDAGDEPNRTVKLRKGLATLWDAARVRVRDRSDLMTFLDPVGKQTPKVERAIDAEPDLVVAIDFLFWFGYGHVSGPDRQKSRLELLERGLTLLDRFECPILVGDFPDMHGADARMLSASQIPSVETLAKLNERVAAWAAERERVLTFPLAARTAEMKTAGMTVEVDDESLKLGPDLLLQSDKLHPTRLGIAIVIDAVAELLATRFEQGDALRPPATIDFEQIVSKIGASSDIDLALETAGR